MLGGGIAFIVLPLLTSYWIIFIPCAAVYIITFMFLFDAHNGLFRILFLITFTLSLFFYPFYSPALSGDMGFKINQVAAMGLGAVIALAPFILYGWFNKQKTVS